jgi:regulator of protease activity HflC (stomatin/prohibitin superfamily)
MPEETAPEPTLAAIEEQVLAEGREWMRQRLQEKLQEQADRISRSFSPKRPAAGAAAKKKAHAAKQRGSR